MLELVEAMHFAKLQITSHFARARLDTQEIHFSHAEKSQERLQRGLKPVSRRLVVRILSVVKWTTKLFVPVCQIT